MVIVDEREFLSKELENQGFNIFDFYEDHQVMDLSNFCQLPLTRRAEVILVDTQTILDHPDLINSFQSVMNTFLGVIFFHSHQNEAARQWVNDQAAFLKKIIGEYALPMPQLQWTMLSNQLQFLWTVIQEQKALQRHLVKFSHELDQALQTAETEMLKAKKVHEILIPKRSDEIKGVSFLNKYAAGDGGGGEFYDLIQTSSKVFQILISSQSYLISSSLIGLLNHHKQKDFSPAAFFEDAKVEVDNINNSKKKKADVQVYLLELDLSQLTLTASGFGAIQTLECLSLKNGKVRLDSRPYQMAKGEKIIVFSPGFVFNWNEGRIKKDLHIFVNEHQHLSQTELMMELFLQLKLVQESDFLTKDATVVMMEVNRHGIHQI
jgi:hypothetical protein